MLGLFREQPRAFSMIFMLEIWERFGFYTAQGILTLYFIRFLGFTDEQAYYTFGAFSALVYGLVAAGGYLGDSVIGTKRAIVLGLVTLCAGYLWLSLAGVHTVFGALGLIAVGNGLFKANPSSLLAKCYAPEDSRLHGAFTLYYMAINLGSTVALIAGPFLSSKYGYFYAYLLSAIGLGLGLLNYALQRHVIADIQTFADEKPIALARWLFILACIALAACACSYLLAHVVLTKWLLWLMCFVVTSFYFSQMRKEPTVVQKRMLVAFVLMLEAVLFFTLYQQMPTSINLFAVNNVVPRLLGITFDPQSLQALNPIWIISLSPLLAMGYRALNARGMAFHVPYKFAAGMLCCGLSFMLLFFPRFIHDASGMVSAWWLVASYFFQSTGELLVSALGVAMVAELVPSRMNGFVMGMWFLTTSVAGFTGAFVASMTAIPEGVAPGIGSLYTYTGVFAKIGIATLLLGFAMWLFAAHLSRIIAPKTQADLPDNQLFQEHLSKELQASL